MKCRFPFLYCLDDSLIAFQHSLTASQQQRLSCLSLKFPTGLEEVGYGLEAVATRTDIGGNTWTYMQPRSAGINTCRETRRLTCLLTLGNPVAEVKDSAPRFPVFVNHLFPFVMSVVVLVRFGEPVDYGRWTLITNPETDINRRIRATKRPSDSPPPFCVPKSHAGL